MQQYFISKGEVVKLSPPEDLSPIKLTVDLFKELGFVDETGGWGGSQGSDYCFSKKIGDFKLLIRTVDYDHYWHVANFERWKMRLEFLHELQFVYYLVFREELIIK